MRLLRRAEQKTVDESNPARVRNFRREIRAVFKYNRETQK